MIVLTNLVCSKALSIRFLCIVYKRHTRAIAIIKGRIRFLSDMILEIKLRTKFGTRASTNGLREADSPSV